jgi:NRPS condensation-like uncharacterized protein
MMSENQNLNQYERRITTLERLFSLSPFSIVTVVARIKGEVTAEMLKNAVAKVQQRHTNLRVRIKKDDQHASWFTSAGVGEIPVEVVPRRADDQWIEVHQKASQIPFEFDTRPALRFILVQSPSVSEVIILCHHIICDGLSLAYLARDLLLHLGDPTRDVEVLPDPAPIESNNMPAEVSLNGIVKFFLKRINKQWAADPIFFDLGDYRDLSAAYWQNFNHQIFSLELTEAQTEALVVRCRKEQVTVNSALTTAFTGAQTIVQGEKPYHTRIGVAASVRDRLQQPVGEVMGFYAGLVNLNLKYK